MHFRILDLTYLNPDLVISENLKTRYSNNQFFMICSPQGVNILSG